jgi:hypothetical protein
MTQIINLLLFLLPYKMYELTILNISKVEDDINNISTMDENSFLKNTYWNVQGTSGVLTYVIFDNEDIDNMDDFTFSSDNTTIIYTGPVQINVAIKLISEQIAPLTEFVLEIDGKTIVKGFFYNNKVPMVYKSKIKNGSKIRLKVTDPDKYGARSDGYISISQITK